MTVTAAAHDHIVLLLNTQDFENPPQWLTTNFNIIEGGTHTGGSSRNKLIIFKDGTYLELFNWIKEPIEFTDWGDKPPGLIDFALTTMPPVSTEQNFETVQANLTKIPPALNVGVLYDQPQSGGRKRADGTQVKWQTTRPTYQRTTATPDQEYYPTKRMDAPFFCHDITERIVRVPFNDDTITTHPCGAVGIENVQILVPETHIGAYIKLYGAILDVEEPQWSTAKATGDEGAYFLIDVPNPVDTRPSHVAIYPSRENHFGHGPDTADNTYDPEAEDEAFLTQRGIGIQSITLRTAEHSSGGNDVGSLGSDSIGKTVKLKGGSH